MSPSKCNCLIYTTVHLFITSGIDCTHHHHKHWDVCHRHSAGHSAVLRQHQAYHTAAVQLCQFYWWVFQSKLQMNEWAHCKRMQWINKWAYNLNKWMYRILRNDWLTTNIEMYKTHTIQAMGKIFGYIAELSLPL